MDATWLGFRIRQARERRGLSQEDLAAAVSKDQRAISEYEAGNRKLAVTGSQKPFAVLSTPADELDAQFSSDSRWIAFTSDESGRDEVYVQAAAYEESGPARTVRKWQVSTMGGGQPKWRADGKEIFYRSAAGALTSVAVRRAASELVFGTPRALFPLSGTPQFRGTSTYESTGDGQRFVILSPIGTADDLSITIVTSW